MFNDKPNINSHINMGVPFCESGHPKWLGKQTYSIKEANKEAEEHDKSEHNGVKTAVVVIVPSP